MNIQVVSDLHIEYIKNMVKVEDFITPKSSILVLAGDIGSLYRFDQLFNFLKDLSKLFKYILYVPGNHEFYMLSNIKPLPFRILLNRLYQMENDINNLYILNKSSVIIDDICFIGSTLWSNVPNDFHVPKYRVRIKGFNTYLYQINHNKDKEFIEKTLQFCQKKNIKSCVITHYPPLKKCLGKSHQNDKFKFLYYNNLDNFFTKYKINCWIYGHVHYNQSFVFNNCICFSNQLGRVRDNITNYLKDFTYNF
jgi:predicted phosphodiesterase